MITPVRIAEGVWVATTAVTEAAASTHHDDVRRAASLPDWRSREFLAARGLLRALLHAVQPARADDEVAPDPRGRPELRGHPQVGIGVSHSEGRCAAVVAVGRTAAVDVQVSGTSVNPSFTRRLLGDRAALLADLTPRRAAEELAWVWTAQEACVKAAGTGLAGRPWAIDVPPGAGHGRWGRYRWISLRDHSPIPLSCAFGPRTDETGATAREPAPGPHP